MFNLIYVQSDICFSQYKYCDSAVNKIYTTPFARTDVLLILRWGDVQISYRLVGDRVIDLLEVHGNLLQCF